MIKVARHKGEEGKVAIRNVRRKAKDELDRIVKDGEAGEDDGRRGGEGARRPHPSVRPPPLTNSSSTRKRNCSKGLAEPGRTSHTATHSLGLTERARCGTAVCPKKDTPDMA